MEKRFVEKGAAMKVGALMFVCCAFLLSGCGDFSFEECFCGDEGEMEENRPLTIEELSTIAYQHEQKLRNYFTYGSNSDVDEYGGGDDVSTLISQTMAISAQFREKGMYERANQFDSYVDVLMYGNLTIDESIKDVQDLVKGRSCIDSITSSGYSSRNLSSYDYATTASGKMKRRCRCNQHGPCAKCLDSILP